MGRPLDTRWRMSVEEMASAGMAITLTLGCSVGAPRSNADRSYPGLVAVMKCAIDRASSGSFHWKISSMASAPVMKNSSTSPRSSRRAWSVSTEYVGPSRSISRRDTEKRGLADVAMTAIRYRSSAGETFRSCFIQGRPVGTNTTSSRWNCHRASSAVTRCPWWMGSNVPPITPRRLTGPTAGLYGRSGRLPGISGPLFGPKLQHPFAQPRQVLPVMLWPALHEPLPGVLGDLGEVGELVQHPGPGGEQLGPALVQRQVAA